MKNLMLLLLAVTMFAQTPAPTVYKPGMTVPSTPLELSELKQQLALQQMLLAEQHEYEAKLSENALKQRVVAQQKQKQVDEIIARIKKDTGADVHYEAKTLTFPVNPAPPEVKKPETKK